MRFRPGIGPRVRRRGHAGHLRLALVALFGMSLALMAPAEALAHNDGLRLVLRPIGQAGSYFDLSMRPGETRSLSVEVANAGDAPLAARTYAADVYTIINGGFGGRLRDENPTGMTRWLDYATDVLQLPAGGGVRRTFAITVPADAGPGEYITSIVLENDRPIQSGGAVALDQIVRQAIAVVVTVPGPRSPGLAIGEASHAVVAGRSIVSIAVENTGNVRLKPVVTFTLLDSAGALVSHASVQMDTFYAHTDTFVEIPLAALLLPGTYSVRLTLDDATQSVQADRAAIALVVVAPPAPSAVQGGTPALTEVSQTPAGQPSPAWGPVLVAGLALGGLGGIGLLTLALGRRRRPRTSER